MTWPLEGSREIDEGIIISEPMDWCKSPTSIVPYRLYAYQQEAMDLADSVKQTSDRTHVKDSLVLKSYGDEPGVGGGVLSGTHNAECTPKTWSGSVTAQGRNVVRHDDEWWMNRKNTWGRLTYVKDPKKYLTPSTEKIDPTMSVARLIRPAPDGAELFEASAVGVAGGFAGGLAGGAEGAEEGGGVGGAIGGPIGAVAGAVGAGVLGAIVGATITGSRTTRKKPDKCPCIVQPYVMLKNFCASACKNGQAHHIVPDFTKRYVSRVNGLGTYGRISGLANYNDGMAICLQGNAKDNGSEHYEAHGADSQIEALGNNHPDTPLFPKGTAPIGEIRARAEQQTASVRPQCEAQIEAGLDTEFAATNPMTLGRTTVDRLPTGNALTALQNQTVH